MMSNLKAVIKYFSKSGVGIAMLLKEHNLASDDEPMHMLKKIGKTDFGTHWTAANALEPCLPHIKTLVHNKSISFQVSTHATCTNYLLIFIDRIPGFKEQPTKVNGIWAPYPAICTHSCPSGLVSMVSWGCKYKCCRCLCILAFNYYLTWPPFWTGRGCNRYSKWACQKDLRNHQCMISWVF